MVESILVRIRKLMKAVEARQVTADEAMAELEILWHRHQLRRPIPLHEAVAKMTEIARQNPHSRLRRETDDGT